MANHLYAHTHKPKRKIEREFLKRKKKSLGEWRHQSQLRKELKGEVVRGVKRHQEVKSGQKSTR